MQQHIDDYVQPGRIKPVTTASVSLKKALLSLEPFIMSQEIIPDTLLVFLQQLADADLSYSPLLRQLQLQLDNFEHPEAMATLKLLKAKYPEQ